MAQGRAPFLTQQQHNAAVREYGLAGRRNSTRAHPITHASVNSIMNVVPTSRVDFYYVIKTLTVL